MILAQCRARFILNKPKSEVNQKNIAALKSKRRENAKLQNNLKQAFNSKHKRIRQNVRNGACKFGMSTCCKQSLHKGSLSVEEEHRTNAMLHQADQFNSITYN